MRGTSKTEVVTADWRPPVPRRRKQLRAGIDAVLALIEQHRDTAARFTAVAGQADANAAALARRGRWVKARRERDRARRARRTAEDHLGASHYIVEALTTAWGQWPAYQAAADAEDREGT